jgi:hypothetical protein
VLNSDIFLIGYHKTVRPIEPDEVRIAYVIINQWQRPGLSYELETLILQATHPPYNVKIHGEVRLKLLRRKILRRHRSPWAQAELSSKSPMIYQIMSKLLCWKNLLKWNALWKQWSKRRSRSVSVKRIASFLDKEAFSFEDCLLA